jgi:hypothetical protein
MPVARRPVALGPPGVALLGVVLLAGSSAPPVTAAPAGDRCLGARADGPVATTASVGGTRGARVFVRFGPEDDDLYGPETRVYGCRKGARPRRLETLEAGIAPTFTAHRFSGAVVGFTSTDVDVQCTKGMGGRAPECVTYRLRSYDLRSGRRRAAFDAPATTSTPPRDLRVGTRGWMAWTTRADGGPSRRLWGLADGAPKLLDTGAVEPSSIRVRGDAVTWRRDGLRRTTALR